MGNFTYIVHSINQTFYKCRKVIPPSKLNTLVSCGDPVHVGYEGELQLSQFDLQKTFFRELNYTRSESGRL
jgi:hypothetical protein